MRHVQLILAVVFLPLAAAFSLAVDQAKGKKVEFEVHRGYLERVSYYQAFRLADKTKLGLQCFVAFADQDSFDKAFGKSEGKLNLSEFLPNGEARKSKPKYLPRDVFDKKIVVAMIHTDPNIYQYKVTKVTADGETLYVQYVTNQVAGPNNTYACPLIVSVDRSKVTSVVFIENGMKIGTAEVPGPTAK
jgi:hypothetical protein